MLFGHSFVFRQKNYGKNKFDNHTSIAGKYYSCAARSGNDTYRRERCTTFRV